MRPALIIIAALAGAAALGLLLLWPTADEAAQEDAALPLYVGGEDGGDEIEPDAFGPGPTVCSMDPRYRPRPGAEQTCPVIP